MSSFEELLAQTQRQNEFDILYDALLEIALDQSTHYATCNKIYPFLAHVHDGGNLNAQCVQLQNPDMNEIVLRSMVHNVVNSSKTNEKLKKVLEAVIGI